MMRVEVKSRDAVDWGEVKPRGALSCVGMIWTDLKPRTAVICWGLKGVEAED